MTDLDRELTAAERDELGDHVSNILFDAMEAYDPDCLFCQRARALGLFAEYGFRDADLDAAADTQRESRTDS